MLSHPNFHKCEHFAQELESFDSAHRCAVRANGSSQYGCVPHSPNSQTQALVGTTIEQILTFQRCFSQTLQKTCFNEIGEPLVFIGLVFFDGQAVEYLSV
jgi:hypothetical protein